MAQSINLIVLSFFMFLKSDFKRPVKIIRTKTDK